MVKWIKDNIVCIVLVLIFIPVYFMMQRYSWVNQRLGTTSIEFLNGEYYRWGTCMFLHYGYKHILYNSIALIAVGSLISPYIGKIKTLLIFLAGGILAEVAFSYVVTYGAPSYGGGSSGGIFALIAAFICCYLRAGKSLGIVWYRPDLLITLVFMVLANDNLSSFLTHCFGFIAGVLLTTLMIVTGLIGSGGKKK